MYIAQRGDHLEFDDDPVLDQKVSSKFANDHAIVENDDSPLLNNAEPALSDLMSQGILLDLFNEPMTERIGDPESATNDPFGHRR